MLIFKLLKPNGIILFLILFLFIIQFSFLLVFFVTSLFQRHPSFAQAAVTIATVVNEESAKTGMKANTPGEISF